MIKRLFLSVGLLLLCGVLAVAAMLQIPPRIDDASEPEILLEALNTPHPQSANLVSIQPYLTASDYASTSALQQKLRGYFVAANEAGWLHQRSLVVLPEHIGTWLVAEGESFAVFSSEKTTTALLWSALGNLSEFLRQLPQVSADDPFAAALFTSKSSTMARQYQEVFSALAREFGVSIVAGSIVLPAPEIRAGDIRTGEGPLYNTSFLFYADGRVAGPVRKVYPIDSELPFIQPATQPLPTFDTPLGKLAILICADSWYPDTWQQIADAELVAVPSYSSPDGLWDTPWGGYNGAPTPADVVLADVGQLTEGQAWRKYALAGRGAHLQGGINTFFRGDLWDLGDDGRTTAIYRGEVLQGARRDGPIISSLWLQ